MDEYPLKWITDYLAVGYAPRSAEHLESIHNAGIKAIVNLCAECYDLHVAEQDAGFAVYYLAVADEEAPPREQVDAVINWIDSQKKADRKVLVHCRYGIGRTGTVVLAYLLHCGIAFDKAQKMMEHTPSWPSTNAQKRCVDDYIAALQPVSVASCFKDTNSGSIGKFFRRLEAALKWDD